MSGHVVVLCTVGSIEEAESIARGLVEDRVAACVNVVPTVVSVYRWQGSVERDEERLLIIKTRAERFDALREAILARHSYDVPEIVALPLLAGHEAYLT